MHNSNNGFIFTSLEDKIIQLKIINDSEGNCINLEKFDEIENSDNNNAIITTNDGKIFYISKNLGDYLYDKTLFVLENYNIQTNYEINKILNKYLNF